MVFGKCPRLGGAGMDGDRPMDRGTAGLGRGNGMRQTRGDAFFLPLGGEFCVGFSLGGERMLV